jgi:drug/metabolite transporter (DMT)-like permease
LAAGTGALILFGSVQLTMIAVSLVRGERPRAVEWLGLVIAVGGLVYLVLPGLQSPPLTSSLLMAAAGAAWGMYTLRGRSSSDPLAETAGNFIRTLPFAAIAMIIFLPNLHMSRDGVLLAAASGAIASGIGYTAWYAALKHHTATRAAVLQLSVPALTAVLGILFLAETASQRLLIAGALIVGGILLTILGRKR